MSFQGKVVIVTGGGGGLGRLAAQKLGAYGARIVVADQFAHTAEGTRKLITQGGGSATAIRTDVSQTPGVQAMLGAAVEWGGRIDALVHCAVISSRGRVMTRSTASDMDRVMGVNVRGAFLCAKEFSKVLIEREERGRFVCISSAAALDPPPEQSLFSASQAAVIALMRTHAREVEDKGIRINTLCPAFGKALRVGEPAKVLDAVDGLLDLNRNWSAGAPPAGCNVGALNSQEAVIAAIAFLASDRAGTVTGCTFDQTGAAV